MLERLCKHFLHSVVGCWMLEEKKTHKIILRSPPKISFEFVLRDCVCVFVWSGIWLVSSYMRCWTEWTECIWRWPNCAWCYTIIYVWCLLRKCKIHTQRNATDTRTHSRQIQRTNITNSSSSCHMQNIWWPPLHSICVRSFFCHCILYAITLSKRYDRRW